MDNGHSKKMRPRELPPLPQRSQRALPAMPSQDTTDDMPTSKTKKKRLRKEQNGGDSVEHPGLEMMGQNNRRASEVGEQLNQESSSDAPPQRRRRKKKTPTIDVDDDQADLVNEDGAEQNTDGEEVPKKPKKKKKLKTVESQLHDELDVEEDDIITDVPLSKPQHSLFTAPQGQSQPVGKVFVEKSKRFHAAERSDWRKTSIQMDNITDFQHIQPLWTTRDVSVRLHAGFRVFGLYCHGFLAGYAVWNTVMVYMLAGRQLTALSNLLEQYHSLAYPFQSLLYMLLAISTVATFDRVNLAKGSMAMQGFITLDPVALASFFYFSALILSLSQQMTSDRINLYPTQNATLWPPGSEHQILHPWVTVNLVVALLVGLAWIFIATRPETDYTQGYLMTMEIEPPRPEDKSEMTA
ncbi:transmembrane protein 237A-like [Synchiropus splendidus]|uniref:transmembrane protein 237A-like n=1 Tax=Synchiropus splendidus TaxID=270530 RepID=UPI00237DBA0C|nr:transmembrane protein 237A-like [Synchiropus splendidus]